MPLGSIGRGNRTSPIFILSYTPTLTALSRARQRGRSSRVTERPPFIAIGQAQTLGEQPLLSVGSELASISQRVAPLGAFTRIEGPDPTIARATAELNKNEWVHLACYGIPDQKHPFESAFALHAGHLKVEDIMRCDIQNLQFGYLSACHTAVGDEASPDEVIHLASAMQFSGSRSVIGTTWAVDDAHTDKITPMFYENMVDANFISCQLHSALWNVRRQKEVGILSPLRRMDSENELSRRYDVGRKSLGMGLRSIYSMNCSELG